jgi:hypothetical protein
VSRFDTSSPREFLVPERGSGSVSLFLPCHPAAGMRALIGGDDRLVLLCGDCLSPFLALRDWEPEPQLPAFGSWTS